ncbi:MAG: YceI family protein [Bacteroidia bacterium]|nr:YceI family protein [Bacteroidia bacterium]
MKGVIDTDTRSFAFSVSNESFQGFNSDLQKDHFNENYIESDKNPSCLFSGKIIDDINFLKDGTYLVRVKGILNIKGIPQERIIKSTIWVKGNDIFIECDFGVLLADHEIRIPRIVQQKIAPEIKISVKAKLKKEVKK